MGSSSAGALTFGPDRVYSNGGATPTDVEVVDIDRDGHLDIVTANPFNDTVSLLQGSGNGTMLFASTFSGGEQPMSIEAADFDRDGRLDLAITQNGEVNPEPIGSPSIPPG